MISAIRWGESTRGLPNPGSRPVVLGVRVPHVGVSHGGGGGRGGGGLASKP